MEEGKGKKGGEGREGRREEERKKTSFDARDVFVSTVSTLLSDSQALIEKAVAHTARRWISILER